MAHTAGSCTGRSNEPAGDVG